MENDVTKLIEARRKFMAEHVERNAIILRALSDRLAEWVTNDATREKYRAELNELLATAERARIALRIDPAYAAVTVTTLHEQLQAIAKRIFSTVHSQELGSKGGKDRIFTATEVAAILRLDKRMAAEGDVKEHGRAGRLISEASEYGAPLMAAGKAATVRQVKALLDRQGILRKKT